MVLKYLTIQNFENNFYQNLTFLLIGQSKKYFNINILEG